MHFKRRGVDSGLWKVTWVWLCQKLFPSPGIFCLLSSAVAIPQMGFGSVHGCSGREIDWKLWLQCFSMPGFGMWWPGAGLVCGQWPYLNTAWGLFPPLSISLPLLCHGNNVYCIQIIGFLSLFVMQPDYGCIKSYIFLGYRWRWLADFILQ